MSSNSKKPSSRLINLLRCHQGGPAVEFALLIIPFLALLYSTLELGLIFLNRIILIHSVDQAVQGKAYYCPASLTDSILEAGLGILKNDKLSTETIYVRDLNDQNGKNLKLIIFKATYVWDLLTPFISKLLGSDGHVTLTHSTLLLSD